MPQSTDTQALAVVASNANVSRSDSPQMRRKFYPQRFTGKVAVVTGASRGIGLGVAQRLAREGAKVVITGRNADSLAQATSTIGGPLQVVGVAGKADDPEHREQVFVVARDKFGSVDVLVNNVGINPVYGPAESLWPVPPTLTPLQ